MPRPAGFQDGRTKNRSTECLISKSRNIHLCALASARSCSRSSGRMNVLGRYGNAAMPFLRRAARSAQARYVVEGRGTRRGGAPPPEDSDVARQRVLSAEQKGPREVAHALELVEPRVVWEAQRFAPEQVPPGLGGPCPPGPAPRIAHAPDTSPYSASEGRLSVHCASPPASPSRDAPFSSGRRGRGGDRELAPSMRNKRRFPRIVCHRAPQTLVSRWAHSCTAAVAAARGSPGSQTAGQLRGRARVTARSSVSVSLRLSCVSENATATALTCAEQAAGRSVRCCEAPRTVQRMLRG